MVETPWLAPGTRIALLGGVMTQTLFHGSPAARISEIRATGVFGGLFASESERAARSHGDTLYVIESTIPLTDYALNYEIEGAYEIALEIAKGDEARADAIMSRGCEWDSTDPEDGWEIQRLRGELAALLGYTSVEMADEHGATWLCLPGCTIRKIEEQL